MIKKIYNKGAMGFKHFLLIISLNDANINPNSVESINKLGCVQLVLNKYC